MLDYSHMLPEQSISNHFIWRDVVHSSKGERARINNTPGSHIWPGIAHTAKCMDAVREILGAAIIVDSWFRCIEVNTLVGSKYTSQHIVGEAVDWVSPTFGNPLRIARALVPHIDELQIDQIILEYSWIHTSFCTDPHRKPRGMVITLKEDGGYAPGLTDLRGNPLN